MRLSTKAVQEFLRHEGNNIYDVESLRRGMALVAQIILNSDEDRLSSSGYEFCKDCVDLENINC